MESNSVEQHGAGNREVPRNRRAADDSRGVRSAASSFGLEVDRVEAFAFEIMQRHREHRQIHLIGPKGSGIDRAGDKLPERGWANSAHDTIARRA